MLRSNTLLAIAFALAAHMVTPAAAGIPPSKFEDPAKYAPVAHPLKPLPAPEGPNSTDTDEEPPSVPASPIAHAVDFKVRAIRRAVQGHAAAMHTALRALQETLQGAQADEPPETTPPAQADEPPETTAPA